MPETAETTETTEQPPHRSDRELRVQRDADRAKVTEVNRRRRAGTATSADYTEGVEAVRRYRATQEELERRADESNARSTVERLMRRGSPMTRARELDPDELEGVALSVELLSDDELSELRKLQRERHRGATAEADARYEELLGKAAGEPGVFARRRDELRRSEEMRAEAERLARAFLPKRRDPEPGSVELPGFLWSWLTNGEADTFDVTDLGVLAALVYSFANESAALFPRGSFVHDEHGPAIALGKVAGQPKLARGADDSERLYLGDRLAILKANRWLELERDRGRLTIRPGERMRTVEGVAAWPGSNWAKIAASSYRSLHEAVEEVIGTGAPRSSGPHSGASRVLERWPLRLAGGGGTEDRAHQGEYGHRWTPPRPLRHERGREWIAEVGNCETQFYRR